MFEVIEVKIKDVVVENRARINMGNLGDLEHSIKDVGLINPITLDHEMNLIAGERRLRAHENLGIKTILARKIPGLNKEDKFLMELFENTTRRDFNWVEELALKFKIHTHYEATIEEWTLTQTAEKLGIAKGGLSSDLTLKEALNWFPELTTFETKAKAREAYKKISTKAGAINAMAAISEEDENELQAMLDQHSEDEAHNAGLPPGEIVPKSEVTKVKKPQFYYGDEDCIEFMERLPKKSVGLCELDPPYAMNYDGIYGQTQKIRTELEDWPAEMYKEKMEQIINEQLPRVLIDGSFVICWTAVEWIPWLDEQFTKAGFKTQKPGAWVKPGGSSNTPSTNLISNFEMFMLVRWGDARFNVPSVLGAFNAPSMPAKDKIHPTEKPIDGVYDYLFKALVHRDTIFAAPFGGSGNSMLAAAMFGMKPMGTDLKKANYYPHFLARIKKMFNGGPHE